MQSRNFAPGLLVMNVFAVEGEERRERPSAAKGAASVALLGGMQRGAHMGQALETLDLAMFRGPDELSQTNS